ncbi:Chromodomain Y-like protein [Fukomys damarensis]|uniref:Chromodomain Y-like protein n=1 Tax=Fukomys damarensis TaxID=885580 RepID=A0A091DV97_FUKDA|nr:Chromodomain Y-like protein [Fukomys damarensis]
MCGTRKHLGNCEEHIHNFNRCHPNQQESTLAGTNRTSPKNTSKQVSRSNSSVSKTSPDAVVISKDHEYQNSPLLAPSQKFRKNTALSLFSQKNMDLAKPGIRILMPNSPIKSRTEVDGFLSKSPEKLYTIEQGSENTVVPEVAAEKPMGAF